MGKHSAGIDPLNELRAKLGNPVAWLDLVAAVQFLRTIKVSKHGNRSGMAMILNASAMRDHLREN